MRISDWSSDVCSSDLVYPHQRCSRHEEPCDDQARPDAVEKSQSEGRPAAARRKDASDEAYGDEAKRDVLHQNLPVPTFATKSRSSWRSEEHTSELQSLMRISYAVFCLKKKKKHYK